MQAAEAGFPHTPFRFAERECNETGALAARIGKRFPFLARRNVAHSKEPVSAVQYLFMQLGKVSALKIRRAETGRKAALNKRQQEWKERHAGLATEVLRALPRQRKLMKWMARTATFCGPGSPYRVLPVSDGADHLRVRGPDRSG